MDNKQLIEALRNAGSGAHNFLQATSNGIADSTLGGLVDMAAYPLRAAGVPVGDAPVGGTDWLRQKGFTRPVESGVPQVLGETLGNTVGTAALAPAELANLVRSGVTKMVK